jgi:hypothetical protein
MGSTRSMALAAILILMLAAVSDAQTTAPPSTPPAVTRQMEHADLRRHIYTMEGALARAVAFGAQRLNREIRNVMPDVMALSGEPQARGVYLEGYGIYFDVSVPVLNQLMVWSTMRMMGPDEGIVAALAKLKSYVQNEKNPSVRASMEGMIERLELQLGPVSNAANDQVTPVVRQGVGPGVSAAMVLPDTGKVAAPAPDAPAAAATPASAPRGIDKKYLQDPNAINRAYTESVQNALIDTILDLAIPTALKPHEFLTVAARDNMQRDSLAPPDPYEEVITLLLSIKGSDLAAYRAGQIDSAEVRRRVQVREF